jgi:hypothetical protein
MQLQPWQTEYNRGISNGYAVQVYILFVMVDHHAYLGIVSHQPAGNLTAIHCQNSSWYGLPLRWYFVGYRIRFVDDIL